MSTYWKFSANIVNAATNETVNTAAQLYYGYSRSFSTSSSNRLTLGSSTNVTGGNSNTSFYFKFEDLNSQWTFQKWSCYCASLASSQRTQEFTDEIGGAWDLSSVAQTSSSNRVNCDVTLYVFNPSIQVSFNGNGGQAPSEIKTVTYGGTYGYLPTPTRSGYSFSGWYTAASGGSLVTSDTEVTTLLAHTLYAHWGSGGSSAVISFNAHGGTGAPASVSFTTGGSVTIPDTRPVRSGYIFAGWAVDSNAYQVEYFPGKTYYPASSMTLYAAWRKPISVQTYNASYGANQYREIFSADYASASGLPADVYLLQSLSPYLFVVSCQLSGASPAYKDPDSYVYLSLDTSGSYTMSTMSGTIGSASPSMTETARQMLYSTPSGQGTGWTFAKIVLGIDIDALEAVGLEFEGWFHTAAGGTIQTGYYNGTDARLRYGEELTTEVASFMPASCHHMIAPLVRKKRYVCAFDAQGGTVSPVFKFVTYNDAYGSLPTPTLSEYTFAGWFTEAEGGTQITASTVFTSRLDHVLYAHWTASGQTRTLYFDAAGGTCSTASKAITVGSAVGTLPTPTRTGYTFAGWFLSTVGTDQVTASTVAGEDDFTVYAHWTATTVTITFNANGGTVTEASRNVPYGQQYQRLPIATHPEKILAGWFTEATGGTEVFNTTIATESRTVYAHWQDENSVVWGYTVTFS